MRELDEELGCQVRLEAWLEGRSPVGDGLELAVAVVVLVEGEPVGTEHDRLRWLTPEELDDVDWLAGDRPFLPAVAARLRRVLQGTALDEADARAVAAELAALGYTAEVARGRLAGEDDDEDHPWVVTTDAPRSGPRAAPGGPRRVARRRWSRRGAGHRSPAAAAPADAPRRLTRGGRGDAH